MTLIERSDPRPYLLYKNSPGRPLIIALPGFSQRIAPPGSWGISLGQWNANFVEESGLLDLASERGVSVAFVSSSARWWAPWWRRDWSAGDSDDITAIMKAACITANPSRVFVWGFSDGAAMAHYVSWEGRTWPDVAAVVAHSGNHPRWLQDDEPCRHVAPCLLVIGDSEPHRSVVAAQPEIEQRYRAAGRECERLTVEGGHRWAKERNGDFLDFCERYAG